MEFWHSLSLAVHLIALALWLGGIVFFLIAVGSAVRELPPGVGMRVLNRGRIAFETISWVGIVLVMLTGTTSLLLRNQMAGARLGQLYMVILSIKLVVFVAMLVHHSLQVFKYGPRIAGLTAGIGNQAVAWPEPLRAVWRKWFMLLKINAALAPILILLGLALTRSS